MCKHKLLSLPGKRELPGYCAGGGGTGVRGTGGGCIIHSSLAFTFDTFRYHFCRTTSFSWQTQLQGSGPRSGKQQLEPRAHGSATSAAPAHRGAPGPAGGSSVNTQSQVAVLAQSDTAARRRVQPSPHCISGPRAGAARSRRWGDDGGRAGSDAVAPGRARYSPRRRQRRIPAFWGSGRGMFPPATARIRAALATAGGPAREQTLHPARWRPRARRSLGASARALGDTWRKAPPPPPRAVDVTVSAWGGRFAALAGVGVLTRLPVWRWPWGSVTGGLGFFLV